jgi:hypothetical protein
MFPDGRCTSSAHTGTMQPATSLSNRGPRGARLCIARFVAACAVTPTTFRSTTRDFVSDPMMPRSLVRPASLVVGITHDPAPPYVHAQRVTADLGNARQLTFEGDGHGTGSTSDVCLVQAVAGYVVADILPPQGAVCVQQGERFPAEGN